MRPRPTRSIAVLALLIAIVAIGVTVIWTLGALVSHARSIAVSALSAVVGRDVSIGRVSGAPWSGLAFEEVTIAAARSGEPLPLAVRRATVFLDLPKLARDLIGGRGAVGSITQVMLDEPTVYIERDSAGAWNLLTLLPPAKGPSAPSSAFAGRVIILDGTVTLVDRRRLAPQTFEAQLVDVNGSADFARTPRIAMRVSFVEEREGRRLAARLTGAYTMSTRTLDVDVSASGDDAEVWGPYIVTTPTFRITGGRFDLSLHILRGPDRGQWPTDFSGRIVLRDGRGFFPGRPATLAGVEGEITMANLAFSTSRLRGTLNGSPLEVRGEASFYGEPRFNVAVRSSAMDLTTIGRLFFLGLSPRITGVAKGEVRLSGPLGAPRMEGRVEARGQFDKQPFDNASADISLFGQMMSLVGIRGQSGAGELSGSARWTLGTPNLFLKLQVRGADAAAVRKWSPASLPVFDGRVEGSITALRTAAGVSVAGQASVAGTHLRGVALDSVDTAFRTDPSGIIALDYLLVRQGPSWAIARGRLTPDGAFALEANGGTSDIAALPVPRLRGVLVGRADFAGRLDGTLDAPELAGTILVAQGRAGALSFDAASGRIAVRPGVLSVDDLVAWSGHTRYRASGSVQLDRSILALDLEAERASAETLSRIAGLPPTVSGVVSGRVRLEGPVTRPSAAGSVSLLRAAAFGQRIDEAAAAFKWDGTRLTVAGGSLRRRQSLLRFAGVYDRRTGLGLDVLAQGFDLGDLSLPPIRATRLEGHVDLTGRVTGLPASPVLAADAASPDLTINALRFDQASGAVRWEARTLSLSPLALRLGGERYEIAGELALSSAPQVSLTATVTDGRLSTLLGLANARLGVALDGTVSGTVSVEGPLVNPAARLDLRLSRGHFGDQPLVEGHFDLTMRDRSVTIEDFDLRPLRGRIAATGRYDLGGESQIEVSGSDLDLDLLRPAFRFRRPLTGRLDFTMQLGGTLASPEVGFSMEIARGGLQGGVTFDSLVANAFYRDGLLQIPHALLAQNGQKLRASGSIPFNPALLRFDERGPLDFRLTLADVNLGLLSLITDRVEEGVGAIEGEVRVNGTVAAPRVSGGVQVRDGRVQLRGLQTPIESLRLDLRLDENTIRVAEGTARIGGGTARLDGALRIAQGSSSGLALIVPQDAPLILQANDLRIVSPPILDAHFDGSLRMWGAVGDPQQPPMLDGRITASQGLIAVGPAAEGPNGKSGALVFEGVRFDVGRDLAVRIGGLEFGMKPESSLLLTGTLRSPKLGGTVEAKNGTVTAFGNTFTLEEGTASFQPNLGLRPVIAARAETQVGSARITLRVRGIAPDGLTLDLRSDPDLPRQDILALLGRQAGFSRLLEGDIQGALRAEISRFLLRPATRAISRAFGLSELSVDYDFERPLALRAGARLLTNLYVTATATFSVPRTWLGSLEYRFAPEWRLAFSVDGYGQRQAIVWYVTRF